MSTAPLLLSCCLFLLADSLGASAPLVLENDRLRLEFDARSGAWIGLLDRRDGAQLVAGGARASLVPARRPTLDAERLRRSAGSALRIDLAGEWLYTPRPPARAVEPEFRAGRFGSVPWEPTPVPSRKGVGDDRLRDRTGDFWYRRTFAIPPDSVRAEGELALLIGAVDDFDVAYDDETQEHRLVCGTRGDHEEAGRWMRRQASRIRLDLADQKVGNVDGSPWIRNQVRRQSLPLDDLGLDFYHLSENVHEARREIDGDDNASGKEWAGGLLHVFKHEGDEAAWKQLLA